MAREEIVRADITAVQKADALQAYDKGKEYEEMGENDLAYANYLSVRNITNLPLVRDELDRVFRG